MRFSESQQEVETQTNRDVVVASAMQIATLANQKAMKLRDEGKVEEAKHLLISNWSFCQDVHSKWE